MKSGDNLVQLRHNFNKDHFGYNRWQIIQFHFMLIFCCNFYNVRYELPKSEVYVIS